MTTGLQPDEHALLPARDMNGSAPAAMSPDPLVTQPVTELDLRRLPAPEPMLRALAAMDALAPGATLRLWTPMLPVPLLQALAERGLRAYAQELADGTARVEVVRPVSGTADPREGGDGETRA